VRRCARLWPVSTLPKHLCRVAWAVLALAAAPAVAAPESQRWKPASLDGWLTAPGLWTDGVQAFMDAYARNGFEYESGREVVRAASSGLTFLTNRIWEARVYFADGKARRADLLLYNRGDAAALDQPEFERLVKQVNDGLVQWAGSSGATAPEALGRDSRIVRGRVWRRAPCRAELEWAFSRNRRAAEGELVTFRAEYVRVRLTPADSETPVARAETSVYQPPPSALTLRGRVRRGDNGDLWIGDLPMVDQGEKGYCAAAASERLLRYYGRAVDQHQVAQLADTARDKGTTFEGMIDALKTICHRFQLDVQPLQEFDYNDCVALIKAYNKAAAAKREMTIEYGNTINLGEMYGQMEPAVLRQARGSNAQALGRFRQHVAQYAGGGMPMLWGTMVGIFPENPPLHLRQAGVGGHIRIIIGINAKTDEILYSDTWGPGHELKRLPAADAWAMTVSMHVIKPRGAH